jgi:hypothetical protein
MNKAELDNLYSDINEMQSSLRDQLKDFRVRVNPSEQSDVIDALKNIFPTIDFSKAENQIITFDMFVQCTKVMNKAGYAKAFQTFGKAI